MIHESLTCHLFVLRAWASVIGIRIDTDAATWQKESDDLNILGIHQAHKVLHDNVYTIFVEVTMITEGEEIEFQALALDHAVTGQVENLYLSKVGLSGDGAHRGELRAVELHPLVIVGMLVLEGLQQRRVIIVGILGLSAQQLQMLVFS